MERPVADLLALLKVPGVSTEEGLISAFVEKSLLKLGVPRSAIRYDRTYRQSEYGGNTGNMIIRFPGRGKHPGPSRLFMTHVDTVALCRGAKPKFVKARAGDPPKIVNDNPNAALGADCRSGCGVLLHVARHLCKLEGPRPPVWMIFTVQEELGLIGARGLEVSTLKPDRPAIGFNYDSDDPAQIVHAVIGTTRFFVELYGKAAHAGANPQDGVSTAVAAAKAIADMARAGYHGRIDKAEGKGSANIGVVRGGEMTNTVMDRMSIRGEVRSHDSKFRAKLADMYRRAFERAAADTRNAAGEPARVEWKLGPCYESFALAEDAPVVLAAKRAVAANGLRPETLIDDGGMDANWLNPKGIPMVTMGCGQHGPHTVAEWINVTEYLAACRIAETLATQE